MAATPAEVERTASAVPGGAPTAVELLISFARVAHGAGYPTAELEERLVALADVLDVDGVEASVTPTLIELSVGPLANQRTYGIRVRPRPVDLDAVARLDTIVGRVVDGELDHAGALAALEDVSARPLERPLVLLLAAYGLVGAAVTPLLGGSLREATAALIVGLLVGAVALPAARRRSAEPMVAPVAAAVASLAAATLVELGFEAAPDVVTLAALVTLLPGMTLTIGMRELATEHLQSGVANIASAVVQLLGLVFGVAIGRSIALSWFGPASVEVTPASFSSLHVLAAVAAGLAFTVTLRAPVKTAPLMCAATVLALVANATAAPLVGDAAAVFVAAATIGVVGTLLGRRLRRSSLVFIVPGVLMLVPGSAGFTSVLHLLSDRPVSGISAAFDTLATALSIAYGLMVSMLVVRPRS